MVMTQLLTIDRAAQYLGISKTTIQHWNDHNKYPVMIHPRTGFKCFSIEQLDDMLCNVGPDKS